MSIEDHRYFIAFNQIPCLGPVRLTKILNHWPDLALAWKAEAPEFMAAGLEPKIVQEIMAAKSKINPEQELNKVKKLNLKTVVITDDDYPKLLKEIYCPPVLLYYFGELKSYTQSSLAVVGSRKISSYGAEVTKTLVADLATAGLNIVSGLALGVDACAHEQALNSGGKTFAVVGHGLDKIYPATNRGLAQKIINQDGLIISEFPIGTPPWRHNFPQRNRLISGLSLGILITEAAEKSGALITAAYALEQNRDVFTVPGSIYNTGSSGPHNLIKSGAKLVTTATDILDCLNLENIKLHQQAKEVLPDNQEEKIILNLMAQETIHIDKLTRLAKLNISVINSTLAILEMKGLIKNLGGQTYVRTRR